MSKSSDWKKLDAAAAEQFIGAVASESEPTIFSTALCEVYARPISFYDGYALYRIVNRHMMPYLTLDYLSNGEDHYYMDGSDQAFQNLNARGAISLDVNNVAEYADLYITYVYERGNSLGFIDDPHHMTLKGSSSIEMHFNAIRHHQDSAVSYDEGSERFIFKTPLVYQNETAGGLIEIEASGTIHVMEPIKVSFLENLEPTDTIAYRHPLEDKIIEQARDLLSNSSHGQGLVAFAAEQATPIRVLTSPNYCGLTTNSGGVYITMPAAERTAKYLQALILACGLRDAEQVAAGYLRPHPSAAQDVYAPVNFGKNLDLILEMCKIVKEFEDKQIPEPLIELRNMGLESVYAGFVNDLEWDVLMDIYVESLARYGLLEAA